MTALTLPLQVSLAFGLKLAVLSTLVMLLAVLNKHAQAARCSGHSWGVRH